MNLFEAEEARRLLEADVKMEVLEDLEPGFRPSYSEEEDESFEPRRKKKKKKKRFIKKELKQEKEELDEGLEEMKEFKKEFEKDSPSTPGKTKKEALEMTAQLAREPHKFRWLYLFI